MSETLQQLLEPSVVDWDAVLARLASHPHEAAIEVECDGSLLHNALMSHENDNPMTVDVLNAFLDAHKDAVFEVDRDGDTPLHVACWKSLSAELVKPLLEAGVGVINNDGWLPLHWEAFSLDERSLGILRSLLKVGTKMNVGGADGGGGVLVEDNEGKTPLMVTCDSLLRLLNCYGEDENEHRVNVLWEKVFILARATSVALARQKKSIIPDEDAPLLHALVESKCPAAVILKALTNNPHQTRVRDCHGRTPLAIAASQHDVCQDAIEALLGTDHFDSRIAGIATKEKRLPLHLAAESGWDFEYLEDIRKVAPAALETRDVPTRMHPFMLAAEGPHSNLNAVYQLLRASPRMAHGMAEGIHWENSKMKLQEDYAEQKKEIAELKRKLAAQTEENQKLRERNQVVMDNSGAKRRKIGEAMCISSVAVSAFLFMKSMN